MVDEVLPAGSLTRQNPVQLMPSSAEAIFKVKANFLVKTVQPSLVLEGHLEGAALVSQTNDLVLRAECEDAGGGQAACSGPMSWHLSGIYPSGKVVPLTPSKQKSTIEELHSKDLILPSSFLGALPNRILLNVCFRVNISSQDTADACRRFAFSSPPEIINCATNASNQVKLFEVIWVKCRILMREGNDATEFRVDALQGQSRVTLATAYTPTLFVTLPFFKAAQDICFRVIDRFHAFAEECVATVQVILPPTNQIYAKLQALMNATDNPLEETLRTRDHKELANVISSLASVQAALSYGDFEGESAKAFIRELYNILKYPLRPHC
ncbi:unnamed protein product [Dibothriocephalus latus]|uniref:Uncharacterized protein n=1 Tax=Dibothriocephalus latus TaxID=60516 RepID=A0A3P6TUX9_DIBLA|nr:unnamed protein product [Dibothriocephalus latus]